MQLRESIEALWKIGNHSSNPLWHSSFKETKRFFRAHSYILNAYVEVTLNLKLGVSVTQTSVVAVVGE